ncbi:MAG: aspartyl/glutamyl-tRNA amidotransferase subunit C, partial [Desulfobacterales bacterium]|nr:aspartyl/glutamyl-tRNA amidotransferase subunit C [Desulfobacterales bacterium]
SYVLLRLTQRHRQLSSAPGQAERPGHERRRADGDRHPDGQRHARGCGPTLLDREDALANAPDREEVFFRVPRIIED